MTAVGAERDALAYLAALTRSTPTGWIELRLRHREEPDMRSRFFDVGDLRLAARVGLVRAAEDDVYVGVAVRARKGGGKTALGRVGALWVDCDDQASVDALAGFSPAPAVLVQSSERGRHALWPLATPLAIGDVERGNRRLAHALGACQSSVTNAAAVLRLPGTTNFKYDPPASVELLAFTGQCFEARGVIGDLADPPDRRPCVGFDTRQAEVLQAQEPLVAIPPRVYVQQLTGLIAGRDGKVHCPFHDDKTPSCHLYETAQGGWYCYGCRAGGDVYCFGARVLGIPNRRSTRFVLRRRLYALLLPGVAVPVWRRGCGRRRARANRARVSERRAA